MNASCLRMKNTRFSGQAVRSPTRVAISLAWLAAIALAGLPDTSPAADPEPPKVILAIHGGLGASRGELKPAEEQAIRAALEEALQAGYDILQESKTTSLDAVEGAIRILEDSPLFNAGRGAVFTHEGRNELDASIMEGKDKKAGAVAGVTTIKNPISAARAVMERSKHVLLVGRGAEAFAQEVDLEIVNPVYFWTEPRWKQLQEALAPPAPRKNAAVPPRPRRIEWGTVGAVALDKQGNLAAGTSTGGMTNKRAGRVGDSPIIAAGTYADNEGCAVSATGHGEFFIRFAVAHEVVSLVKYKKLSVGEAGDDVIQRQLKTAGGEGGVIILDRQGRFAAPFNSEGMYRGSITSEGQKTVLLYDEKAPPSPEKK